MKIPFSVYDFFGYLSAGFLVLVGFDYAFCAPRNVEFLAAILTPGKGLFAALLAYIAGHVVAYFAHDFYEYRLVSRGLGRPAKRLFTECTPQETCHHWRRIFPAYFIPLEASTREAVLAGESATGGKLFHRCHSAALREEVAKERLDIFLSLYGFSRNISFACLLVALFLVPRLLQFFSLQVLFLFFAALFAAVVMLYRYLGFYRLYAVEVFRTCTYLKSKASENGT